jgi:hypothetical protein
MRQYQRKLDAKYEKDLRDGIQKAVEDTVLPHYEEKLALYEPPFTVDNTHPLAPPDYSAHLTALIAQGKTIEQVQAIFNWAFVQQHRKPGMPPDCAGPRSAGRRFC